MWDEIAVALGLVLVLEGLAYALFPATLRRMVAEILSQPEGAVRLTGLAMAIIGVGIVWLIRGA